MFPDPLLAVPDAIPQVVLALAPDTATVLAALALAIGGTITAVVALMVLTRSRIEEGGTINSLRSSQRY